MSNSMLIFGIILIVGIALVYYKYTHRMSLHNNVDQLNSVIKTIFKEADKISISQNRLIKGLKQHMGVNEKMALKLIGKARMEGLIKSDGVNVELM